MAYLIVGINTMLIVIFFVTAEKVLEYKQAAVKMLTSLSSDKYQCGKSKPAFLLHSTGHFCLPDQRLMHPSFMLIIIIWRHFSV